MRLVLSSSLVCLLILMLPGCGDRGLDRERLAEMDGKLEKNSRSIKELSLGLDGVNDRLSTIENSLRRLAGTASPSSPAVASSGGGAEMENLSKQVALLTEELAATKQEFASTKGAVQKIAAKASEPTDIGEAVSDVAGNPQEFIEGIDRLVERVSSRIEDAATRRNFEERMAQLRDRLMNPPSPEELYDEFHSLHIEKLNAVTNENDRRAVEEAITRLENCSEQELQQRLEGYARDRPLWEFWGIVKDDRYGVQREDLVETWFANPDQK